MSKRNKAQKALVIPQAGQLMPVTVLKIHVTGIIATKHKKLIKIININTFFSLFILLIS